MLYFLGQIDDNRCIEKGNEMDDLEKKFADLAEALVTCHVLLTVQWNELGEREMRCRSDRKREDIRHIRNQIQVARKKAGTALRALSPTGQTHHSTWESKPIAPL